MAVAMVFLCLIWEWIHEPTKLPYVSKRQRCNAFFTVSEWIKGRLKGLYNQLCGIKCLQSRHRNNNRKTRLRWQFHSSKKSKHRVNLARLKCQHLQVFASQKQTRSGPREVHYDTDSFDIGIDSFASRSLSNKIEDFVGPLSRTKQRIQGLTGTTGPVSLGTIEWHIIDDLGQRHKLTLPNSIYVPEGGVRLLSPQHWAQSSRNRVNCVVDATSVTLHWGKQKYCKTIRLDTSNTNVATMRSAPGFAKYRAFSSQIDQQQLYCLDAAKISDDESSSPNNEYQHDAWEDQHDFQREAQCPTTSSFDLNGPSSQTTPDVVPYEEQQFSIGDTAAKFLRYHYKLGHCSPRNMQEMATQGIIPRHLAKCKVPLCTSCLYGKATRRPWRQSNTVSQSSHTVTQPGQCVSVDQLVSPTPGLIAQLRGIPTTKCYTCATVFVDQFSGFGYTHLQLSTSADQTIAAKDAFEAVAKTNGISVLHYHADNGIFADNKFRAAVREKQQTLSFCGVNAHWQNDTAEKRIRDVTELARTMLIHANRRWKDVISPELWPYTVRHASHVINNTPSLKREHNGRSPAQIFSRSSVNINIKHWLPWGCPTYVLDGQLQNQRPFNKWNERSRIGVYLGVSAHHARNVALVLSLTTGLVSPQFHVKFDSNFETVKNSPTYSSWRVKCHFRSPGASHDVSPTPPSAQPLPLELHQEHIENHQDQQPAGNDGDGDVDDATFQPPPPPTRDPQLGPQVAGTTSRYGRQRRATERLIETYEAKMEQIREHYVSFDSLQIPESSSESSDGATSLLAYKTTSDPDTMYLHEALQQPDRDKFLQAMVREIDDQQRNGNWTIVPRTMAPQGTPIMPTVWSMKRKRRISTQEAYKWKARLTLDGSKQQKGVNYWETYAPVASWPLIRLVITIAIINKWHSKQIDYVMAFTQAKAESTNLYMSIPKGFNLSDGLSPRDYVLHIKRNIYGQKQGSKVWYQHLHDKLLEAGLQRSKFDECLYFYKNSIYVLYTDDSILVGPDESELDEIIQRIKSVGLKITEEGSINEFLGVKITRDEENSSITMSQPQLIESVLKDLRLQGDSVVTKNTPAKTSDVLRRGTPESLPFDNSFHYRSVIGKLNYLSTTRPDIACAVHQCARFSIDPKQHHASAVRWIGRYLASNKDKGMTFTPNDESFHVYVDSDFAGNWNKESASWDADTARSRAGFIITYANCPIYWSSKLLTEISLSTTEAEYIAASDALRCVIPMMHVITELANAGFKVHTQQPQVHCKLFEDNSGALEILKVPKIRPRTKHINQKYHFFRSYVDQGFITIHKIDTSDQPADILTKSVPYSTLIKHRLRIMGW